jgi:hypothetical protein
VFKYGLNKEKGSWKAASTLTEAVALARRSIPEDLVSRIGDQAEMQIVLSEAVKEGRLPVVVMLGVLCWWLRDFFADSPVCRSSYNVFQTRRRSLCCLSSLGSGLWSHIRSAFH